VDILLAILGVALLLAAVLDILWTTIWVDGGAGPITARVTSYAWRMVRVVGHRRQLYSLFGPTILILTIAVWVALLWAGWTLIFAVDETSVLSTSNRAPAGWTDRAYFAGYVVFTLGNGDFAPNGRPWQIATALASGTGLLLLTLVITYVGSVISAVVQKRSMASQLTGLGTTPEGVLRNSWDGRAFQSLELPLSTLTSQLVQTTEQHFAYPILHYYRGMEESKSPAVALAVLDDALTVLQFGVPPESRPSAAVLSSARSAVQGYLDTLRGAHIDLAQTIPSLPSLESLRHSGLPTLRDDEFIDATKHLGERRRALLGLVQDAGWKWPA